MLYEFTRTGIREGVSEGTNLNAMHMTREQLPMFIYHATEARNGLFMLVDGGSAEAGIALMALPAEIRIDALRVMGDTIIIGEALNRLQNIDLLHLEVPEVQLALISCRSINLRIVCVVLQPGNAALFSFPSSIYIKARTMPHFTIESVASGIATNPRIRHFTLMNEGLSAIPILSVLATKETLENLHISDWYYDLPLKPNIREMVLEGFPYKIVMSVSWGQELLSVPYTPAGSVRNFPDIADFLKGNMPSEKLTLRSILVDAHELVALRLPPTLEVSYVTNPNDTSGSISPRLEGLGRKSLDIDFYHESQAAEFNASLHGSREHFGTNANLNTTGFTDIILLLTKSTVLKSLRLTGSNNFTPRQFTLLASLIGRSTSLEGFMIRVPSNRFETDNIRRLAVTTFALNTKLQREKCWIVRDTLTLHLSEYDLLMNNLAFAPPRAYAGTLMLATLPRSQHTPLSFLLSRSGDNAILTRVLLFLLNEDERDVPYAVLGL